MDSNSNATIINSEIKEKLQDITDLQKHNSKLVKQISDGKNTKVYSL